MKKLLSVLLLLCMLLTLLPVAALADAAEASVEPSGEVTTEAGEEPEDEEQPEGETTEENEAISLLDGDSDTESICYVYVSCNRYGTATVKVNGQEQPLTYGSVTAKEGDKITIVTSTKNGYSTYSACSLNVWNDGLTVTENPKGTYSFVVPANPDGGGQYSVRLFLDFYPEEAVTVTYHGQNGSGEYTITHVENYLPDSPVLLDKKPVVTVNPQERTIYGWAVGSPDSETVLPVGSYQFFTQDTDLYARYEESVNLMLYYGSKPELESVSTKEKYTMKGGFTGVHVIVAWSTEPDGGGERYEVGEKYLFEKDTVLYPIYADEADVVTVKFHYLNLYNNAVTDIHRVKKGDAVRIGSTMGSQTLAYWAVGSEDSSEKYITGETVTVNEDLELYGVLATETVNLTFCFGDGDGENDKATTMQVAKGFDVILEYSLSDQFGMVQVGWSLEKNGAPIENNRTSFDKDTTIYALWAQEILVTYDANGGVGGEQFTMAAGKLLDEDRVTVLRDDYLFKGWSTDKDGAELFDFTKPVTGNTTLYAVWEKLASEKTDESTGVTVQVPEEEKIKIAGLMFVASPLPSDKETLVVTVIGKQVSGTVEKSYVLDIYFADATTDEKVEVDGQRTVTVPIPEGWDAQNTMVLFVDPENGRVENMRGTVSADGKTISFVTNHFSYYALVQMAVEPEATPTAKPQSPKTGDEATPAVWAAVLLAACGAAVVTIRRKKENG